MNYTTITINDQKVGLKFGMASFRYLSGKFVEGISFNNGELTEIGIAHLLYGGYYNNCLVKDVVPEHTFEYFVDFIEINLKNADFLAEVSQVLKIWSESDMVKKTTEAAKEEDQDKTKKKSSRGRK